MPSQLQTSTTRPSGARRKSAHTEEGHISQHYIRIQAEMEHVAPDQGSRTLDGIGLARLPFHIDDKGSSDDEG